MTKVMRAACGLLVGLGLALSLALPTAAQGTRELPTGAARVVEKIDLMVLTGTNQIKFHVAQILENNAGIIPGEVAAGHPTRFVVAHRSAAGAGDLGAPCALNPAQHGRSNGGAPIQTPRATSMSDRTRRRRIEMSEER